jgi:hypothetical protein
MLAVLLQTNFFDHGYALVRLTAAPVHARAFSASPHLEFQMFDDSFAKHMGAISANYPQRMPSRAVC